MEKLMTFLIAMLRRIFRRILSGVMGYMTTEMRLKIALRTGMVGFIPSLSGSMFDGLTMWRDGTQATLNGVQTTAGFKIGPVDIHRGVIVELFVPAANANGDTLDVKAQQSTDDAASDAYADLVGGAFPQITGAGQAPKVYQKHLFPTKQWIRWVLTPVGASKDYGKVQLGLSTGTVDFAGNVR